MRVSGFLRCHPVTFHAPCASGGRTAHETQSLFLAKQPGDTLSLPADYKGRKNKVTPVNVRAPGAQMLDRNRTFYYSIKLHKNQLSLKWKNRAMFALPKVDGVSICFKSKWGVTIARERVLVYLCL